MIRPIVVITVDGKPVGSIFDSRLISLSITDNEGIQSDSLTMTLSDGQPHVAPPRRGAAVSVVVTIGVIVTFLGNFVINSVSRSCLPNTITVKGHSADLRSEMKAGKSRHWDNSSIKSIVSGIAGEYGLETKIADAVSSYVYPWIGQQDESDLSFLDRLALRHGALFSIKNGLLLWLERGAGKTAGGATIGPAVISPETLITGSCKVSETDVDRFKTVKAYWHDRNGAQRRPVVVPGDDSATGEHVLKWPYASKEEAEAAAKSAAREMLRGATSMSCWVSGRPDLLAGQPLVFAGVHPFVDGIEFILDRVTHQYTKASGFRTSVSGKLRAE